MSVAEMSHLICNNFREYHNYTQVSTQTICFTLIITRCIKNQQKQTHTGKQVMEIKYGIGDKVEFFVEGETKKTETIDKICLMTVGKHKEIFFKMKNGEIVLQKNITRGAVLYKFKQGQYVKSFHYNGNMKTSKFETGFFMRFQSEKTALVNFGGSTKEVSVKSLESVEGGFYHVGNTQVRYPLETVWKLGLGVKEFFMIESIEFSGKSIYMNLCHSFNNERKTMSAASHYIGGIYIRQ